MNSTFTYQTYPDGQQFLAIMRPHLEADEARYGLMLGLAERVAVDPHFYGNHDPYFATVQEGPTVTVAAIMTPPHGLILYVNPDLTDGEALMLALTAIAQNLINGAWPVPTVNGPVSVSERFAILWSALTEQPHKPAMATRIFMLQKVLHSTYSPGELRAMSEDEQELAVQWYADFTQEAEHNDEPNLEQLHKVVRHRIADQHLYVWSDEGKPVCMVGLTRPTAHGISIGPVYTPPQYRGRGYASSAVAQLSQQMLDSGKAFCSLFTNLANPTPNHIYQQIGYRPLEDFQVYRFAPKQ